MLADCIFAATLVLLGIVGYFGTGRASLTALIPAAFGLLAALFTLLAWSNPSWSALRYATLAVGVLGFSATARALPALPRALGGKVSVAPATLSKGIMSLSCLAFVGAVLIGA